MRGERDGPECIINALPSEIILELFHCVATSHYHWTGPWKLGLVCHRWREVALSCSKLWSCICVSYVSLSGIADPIPMVAEWIRRSGDHPLDIIHCVLPPSVDIGRICFTSLLHHSKRWRSLLLLLPSQGWSTIFNNMEGRFPNLEFLTLFQYPPCIDQWAFEAFRDAPSLWNVHLDIQPRFSINLPWQKLTRMRLRLNDPQHLENVCASSLEELVISHPQHQTAGVHAVSQFLIRSCCNLQFLTLTGFSLTSKPDLIELYQSVPQLIGLSIEFGPSSVTNAALDPLLITDTHCLLPELKVLLLKAVAAHCIYHCEDTILSEVVRSRCLGRGTTPRLCAIRYQGELSQPGRQALELLQLGNLEIILLDTSSEMEPDNLRSFSSARGLARA